MEMLTVSNIVGAFKAQWMRRHTVEKTSDVATASLMLGRATGVSDEIWSGGE